MKFYKLALHLSFFDYGFGRLSIVKYFWLLGGFGTIMAGGDWIFTFYAGVVYVVFCYTFGWWCYRYGYVLAAAEVGNRYNLFQREMRKVYK